MFTEQVSGNGRYDVQVPDATSGRGIFIFGSLSSTTTARIGSSSLVMFPIISYDYTARSVNNAGDINGDGYDDLIIGVPYASRCHVLFGNENGFVNMTEGSTITGFMESDLFGWSVARAGDVNNDTFADILIGAPKGGGESSVGMVYILYSRSVWSDMHISELVDGDGFSIYGAISQESLGISVSSTGDINSDGYDDIIIGALSMHSFFSGAIYVVFGQASMSHSALSVRELTGSIGFAIEGPPWSWFGCSVSGAGDVNGDGVDDMLIGSVPRKMVVETPVSYIIFGKKTGSFPVSVTSLSYSQGVRLTGGGIVVSSVGDVNGDGCDDILLGSDILFEGAGYVLAKPHIFPMLSRDPTTLPTVLPSLDPTQVPSSIPSVKPTAPTITPSVAPTGPTFSPSMTPTQPTSVPSVRPTAPSRMPSASPTIAPSCWPSLSPTVQPSASPSCKPSVCPTVVLTVTAATRSPSCKPTVIVMRRPTGYPVVRPSAMPVTTEPPVIANITYSILIIKSGGVVPRTLNSTHYFVNSTVDVVIEGTEGHSKFTIVPSTNTSLTIGRFRPESDLIDLQEFRTLQTFSELAITTSVELYSRRLLDEQYVFLIILLPRGQSILIANLTATQLSTKNFIFLKEQTIPAVGNTQRSYESLVVLCTVFGSLSLFVLFQIGKLWLEHTHNERLKGRVMNWDSDNVRENPTYVSFNINDSDKSIFSDISSDSEDDEDMDSSIEISSESQESVVRDATHVSQTAQAKCDDKSNHSGSIQSKDSSVYSHDHSRGHRARHGRDMSDCIEVNMMHNNDIHRAQSKDNSVDFTEIEIEGAGYRSYKSSSSSGEEDISHRRYANQQYHDNSHEMLLEHKPDSSRDYFSQQTVEPLNIGENESYWWEQSSSVQQQQQQHQQYGHQTQHHLNESSQYFWSKEDLQWYECYSEGYQQQQQHQQYVYDETHQHGGSNQDVGDYDVEANNYNYQQQQRWQ